MSESQANSGIVLELAEEFLERYRQGQRPALKEYIDRHPELAHEIREVFPAMALMENIALADADVDNPAPEVPEGPALEQLGDYRILREVGRGGMGIVYEAEQVSLGRHVALKVLPRTTLVDATQKRRFEREAKSAARLHHTNIVPIFGVGEHDGLPYYVMQFIQGLGLDEVLDELKRLQGLGNPTAATGGGLRASRKDMSAVDVARSLLTGALDGTVDAAAAPAPAPATPNLPESTIVSKGSDSFTLSSSSVVLPGAASSRKNKKQTYWQSIARIGLQVADALDYAHKQGILHRDIKPSNLLLDMQGRVWVTDFGLARTENEDHLTQTGDVVGTLRYLPPEAFDGRMDKRGDVYSLGLTLYELLAFQPAFDERDRRRLIKRVTTEEAPRLDRLNPAIPRDLVTIVHKAIDREPARRYGAAADFLADLQRFLDDEPIQARRVSALERGWRWCRHHPGVASMTAALALVLLAVTVASLVLAARFNGLAHEQEETAERERQAKEHETTLRKQAEQARQLADTNFAKARKAVDEYFTRVSESQLLQVPGMQPLRRQLLQSALAFYQDFLKQRADDSTLRGDLAAAYLRAGQIHNELGDRTQGREAFEQARRLYEALTKTAPDAVEWRGGLAQSYYWLGRNEEAIALWEKLAQPGRLRFQDELAEAYNFQAIQYAHAGKGALALQAYQRSLAIREMWLQLKPDDPNVHNGLGQTFNNIAVLLGKNGRLADALAMYRRAAEHAEAAFAQEPQVITHGRLLAVIEANIGNYERALHHQPEAFKAYQRAVQVWQTLARNNPAVPSVQSNLFKIYQQLYSYQRELKQTAAADRTLQLAREIGERLPSDSGVDLYNLACFWALCSKDATPGKGKVTDDQQAEQIREADLAMKALHKAIAAGYRDLDLLRKDPDLNSLRHRADFQALEADLAARVAVANDKRIQAHEQALAGSHGTSEPKNRRLQADLAASQHAIALALLDFGKFDEARAHLDKAIAVRETLVKAEPQNAQYQADLAASRFALGDFDWQSGRLADGARMLVQQVTILEKTAAGRQPSSLVAGQLAAMRHKLAQRYIRAGLWQEAANLYSRLIEQPSASAFDHYCAACLAARAGDRTAHRRACEAAIKRFGGMRDFWTLGWLAWAPMLLDHAGEPTEALQRTAAMAPGGSPNEWVCHIASLAQYRAGHFKEAIAQAEQSRAFNPNWRSSIMSGPVLAMAHYRLGHTAEARRWLKQSTDEWRQRSPLQRSPDSLTALPADWAAGAWHDWPTFELLLQQAARLIGGAPPVEEALNHAHLSVLYTQLGDKARAAAEWQAAVKRAPAEPALWLARGRVRAQLGRHAEADADFAQAAALTPNELDRSPQAGWWVIGPFAERLEWPSQAENHPDPARPVVNIDNGQQLYWRPVSADWRGKVDLRPIFNADHISAYALTYVYSPDERTALLSVGGDDEVRLWLNGRLVTETRHFMDDASAFQLPRVPVTLRKGRNTLLCKIHQAAGPHFLYLRIADNCMDQAVLHAELGLWDEAVRLYDKAMARQTVTDRQLLVRCAHAHLLQRDEPGYRRYVARMLELGDSEQPTDDWLVYAGGLLDGVIKPALLAEMADRILSSDNPAWILHAAGVAYYRAGHYQQAIDCFEGSLKDQGWRNAGGHASELGLALAHHRLGHAQEALRWLDQAEAWYEKAIQTALASSTGRAVLYNWADWPSFVILHREAQKQIRGTDRKDDPRLKTLADRTRQWLQTRDRATASYDIALYLWGHEPPVWLARGQRLAELKRNEDAEADFEQAVHRRPADPEVWRQRGRIHFELGQTQKAAADFQRAVELLGDRAARTEPPVSEADRLFVRLADDSGLQKLTAAVARRPGDMSKRLERGQWYARHLRWKEAAADFALVFDKAPPNDPYAWLECICLQLQRGDVAGYRQLCQRLRVRYGKSQKVEDVAILAHACVLAPGGVPDAATAIRLAEHRLAITPPVSNHHAWSMHVLGLAYYRAGQYQSAVDWLTRSLQDSSWQEQPLSWLVLAMAHHQLGQAAECRHWFAKAEKWLHEKTVAVPGPGKQFVPPGWHWRDWLMVQRLHRETKTLLSAEQREGRN